jgi:hypothetical protein
MNLDIRTESSSAAATQRSPAGSAWPIPYYVRALALGLPAYLLAIQMWTWILFVPTSLAKAGYDFRQFYVAGLMLRTGHGQQLYDYDVEKDFQDQLMSRTQLVMPFVSPAYHALLFAPLSLFSFRTAYFLFLAVNIGALVFAFFLMRQWLSNFALIYPWLPAAMILSFLPIGATLIEGQDSVLLTTIVIAAFFLLTRNRNFMAGLVIAIALFKFQIILPTMLLFVIWRRWRFLLGFGVSAALLVSLSVWLAGITASESYIQSLFAIAGLTKNAGWALYPIDWHSMANIHGVIFSIGDGWISRFWIRIITIVLSAAVMIWTAFRGFKLTDSSRLILLAIPCSVLVGHHTYMHDLSVLVLPTLVFLDRFLLTEGQLNRERWISRAAALVFVAPAIGIVFFPQHFYVMALAVFLLLVVTVAAPANVPGICNHSQDPVAPVNA